MVTSLNLRGCLQTLKKCLTTGIAVILEDIDRILDSNFDPILEFRNNKSENNEITFYGQNLVIHKDFQIYFTTKQNSPVYQPNIFNKLNVINFTATFKGIAAQFLSSYI